ncbi:MAG: hypothetical protein KGJ79_16785 [Alphaproteobacteria bacterium]|nr:hypothetical protein [Alphaproteobacteria bacterium]MDE2495698.1 hypothetical protein [Alphaproteobacteria bacterium]
MLFFCSGALPAQAGNGTEHARLSQASIRFSLQTLCDDSDSATYEFRRFRDGLRAYQYDRDELEVIEATLIEVHPKCMGAAKAQLVSSLMQEVADNWENLHELRRADAAYRLAYDYEQAIPHDVLGKIAVAQGWAILCAELTNFQHAKALAAEQTSVARWSYQHGQFDAHLLVESLQFEATILDRVGSHQRADQKRKEATEVLRTGRKCSGFCMYKAY